MTKKSMTISKAMAAIGLCVCMSVGMAACDGAEDSADMQDQATEEVQGSDEDGGGGSESDADDAASDAVPSGEEGESQEGSSNGQEATSSGSESGSTQAAGSSSGSAQKSGSTTSTSSNSGASTNASTSTNASSPASSAATHTHSYTIPITEQVWHEPVYRGVSMCGLCECESSTAHAKSHILNGEYGYYSYVKSVLVSEGYYETVTTGYKCSCGAVK